jgi:mRNA interferase MazF
LILCQITSQRIRDKYSIEVVEADFESGSLRQTSNVRPNRIFTADRGIVLYRIGHLNPAKTEEIIEIVCSIIRE